MIDSYDATIELINQFLLEVKGILTGGRPNSTEFVPRTYDGITELALNIKSAKLEILQLTYLDYGRGPVKDYNGDGTDIWEFGKGIDEVMVYIKLKIQNDICKVLGSNNHVVHLLCHIN